MMSNVSGISLSDYVFALYQAHDFESAFKIFEKEAISLGFDGVLYTYIPKVLLTSKFNAKPLYKVSDGYSPEYLKHYTDAGFERYDPLIRMVEDGVDEPIDWWSGAVRKLQAKRQIQPRSH